ncbi:NusG domain II-containing protein [Listeria costaricensis]|uniref:NusG domain II-containing protein n=1 Tax=Listeria costaricensis TaxID=2026604 RepID=UPI000C08AD6D|nr:NusG domain II-containing protein [Listeria costaricensis]
MFKKMIKPFDIVIVGLLFLFSFLPIYLFSTQASPNNESDVIYAVIQQDGKTLRKIDLTHAKDQTFTIRKGAKYNVIQIQNHQICIKEDNSPDQIGVHMGWKKKAGEQIVCLPHRLLITLESETPDSDDDLIIPN